jgi:hypothetical protein
VIFDFISPISILTSTLSNPPVFNWKQKKILKITKNKERVGKIPRIGYFDDIKHLVDEGKIYRMKDLEVGFTLPAREEEVVDNNDKKKVDITQLFGSHKSFGLIARKGAEEKINFSHGRVFGVRKSLYRTGRSFHDDAK